MIRQAKAVAASLMFLFLIVTGASAQYSGRHSRSADTTPGAFDFYLLALSWAPQFCATHSQNASSSECDPKRHYGFVVHGMWPQNEDGSYPQYCGTARPVADQTVEHMLPIIPARGLIQHEWATHGTCSGLSSREYFGDIEKAFRAIQIPAEYQTVSHSLNVRPVEIEQKFAAANHAPAGAFRVACSEGDFVELKVCLTKQLQYRDCGSGVRDCRASQVTVRATP